MLNSERIGNQFYQNLGKLFYAIAATDQKVRPSEIKRLRKYVRQFWLDVDAVDDEVGTDAAYQIEIVFDWLQETDYTGGEVHFNEFKRFYKEHQDKFTSQVKKLILDTADSIASSFAGKNKSEMLLLQRLKSLFNH
ncbi:hypothetical protein [Flagellimonas allohymeniacidonis]|uniref:TerB family tellurite resistance protein n=1 Tax=Flagellimonas allohymeniacidonis TaxID=2517819 RepID=A0A4Q8QFE9_9FLAO|nr:hypothetical protein [Allomuricauda hymeniacidonis]TAI48417.1 hypothetical protein EW142_01015 [Allomuricauda hymeniacidonis]